MQVEAQNNKSRLLLNLVGSFRLSCCDGRTVNISSKRSKALLAMLATSRNMERTRSWLQNALWCDRSQSQSQASLRRELSNLRAAFKDVSPDLIWANKEMIGLNTQSITVSKTPSSADAHMEFLEGFDLKNEENFEDWLRAERENFNHLIASSPQQFSRAGQPSLSILPDIEGLSQSAEILISGISDTLYEHLPKIRWLDLINSPWESVEPTRRTDKAISAKLNVEYLLKFKCQESGSQKFLHFQLLQTNTNRILWSYSQEAGWPLASNDLQALFQQVIVNVSSNIQTFQQIRTTKYDIPELDVNALVWRSRWHMKRLSKTDAELAKDTINTAFHRHPNNKEVLLQKTFVDGWEAWTTRASRDHIKKLRSRIHHVRDLDPFDARPYLLNGIFELWLRNHSGSLTLFKKSLDLNPCLANTYGNLGGCYNYWGKPKLAIEPLKTSLRLDPLGMENFFQLTELGLSYFMLEDYEKAIHYCDQALAVRPRYSFAHALIVACNFQRQSTSEYENSLQALYDARPNFVTASLEWLPFSDREWLRKITLPITQSDHHQRF